MRRSFERVDRIRHQLMRDVAEVLRRTVKGYDLSAVNVTHVEVSSDFKYATVYYTVLEGTGREEIAGILRKVRPVVQAAAGERLGIRVVPQLRFEYDAAVERGMRLGELFSQLEEERHDESTDREEN